MATDNKLNMITPFGPALGSTNIPKTLIDKINNFVDDVVVWQDYIDKKFFFSKCLH